MRREEGFISRPLALESREHACVDCSNVWLGTQQANRRAQDWSTFGHILFRSRPRHFMVCVGGGRERDKVSYPSVSAPRRPVYSSAGDNAEGAVYGAHDARKACFGFPAGPAIRAPYEIYSTSSFFLHIMHICIIVCRSSPFCVSATDDYE
jgi:hypothetical protein